MEDRTSLTAYRSLRVALGVVPIVAGLDKFTNLLVDWEMYLSPFARHLLPVGAPLFMRAAGVVEVVVGAGILLGQARRFAFVACAWLALIAVELVTGGFLDVAARDAVMAVAAFALGQLARAHERASEPAALAARRPATAP